MKNLAAPKLTFELPTYNKNSWRYFFRKPKMKKSFSLFVSGGVFV